MKFDKTRKPTERKRLHKAWVDHQCSTAVQPWIRAAEIAPPTLIALPSSSPCFCSSAAATRCEARPHHTLPRSYTVPSRRRCSRHLATTLPLPSSCCSGATDWPLGGRQLPSRGVSSCLADYPPASSTFQCLQLLPCAGNYVEASCHAAPDTPAGQTPAAFCRGKTRHATLRGKNKPDTKRYTTKGPRNRLTKVHNASRCPANALGKEAQQHLPSSWLAP